MAYLLTSHFVVLRPFFPFWHTQYAQVFRCSLRHFASSPLVSAVPTSLPFFSSLSLLNSLCFLLCLSIYLNLFGGCSRNCLLFSLLLLGCHGSPDFPFFRGTTSLTSWLGGVRYSCSLQFLVVSLVLLLVSTLCIFSDRRRTVSSKFFNT